MTKKKKKDLETYSISKKLEPKVIKKTKKKKSVKHRVKEIRNGVIVLNDSLKNTGKKHNNKSKNTLSKLIKKKGSPRAGTSKKAQNLYSQLYLDYKDSKFKKKNLLKVEKWFIDNKEKLKEYDLNKLSEEGMLCDFSQSQYSWNEFPYDNIIFSNKDEDMNYFENNIDEIIDDELINKELEEKINWLNEKGFSKNEIREFVEEYQASTEDKKILNQLNYLINNYDDLVEEYTENEIKDLIEYLKNNLEQQGINV